jgi:Replication initiator protein, pSAM2
MSLGVLAQITTEMAREMAVNSGVCIRPVLKRVYDRDTSSESQVPIACGSTREAVCPPCARKARTLRIQQCSEGWHRDTEPRPNATTDKAEDQADEDGSAEGSRRVRSTRRRPDAAELPQVPMANRTVGRTFTTPDGKEYRPSMFLTLTLPSYGPIRPGTGMPASLPRMTTGGPLSMRCTFPSWSIGCGRTCGGAPATMCSTSPPWNPRPASHRTSTRPCGASYRGRSSRR